MDIIHPDVTAYTEKYTSALDTVLRENEVFTHSVHPHAHMLSGQVQGKFLEMVSRMIQPEKILEIGSFTGFSALCLAKGLKPGGILHTIEIRNEDAAIANSFFEKSGVGDRVRLHIGDARDIIPGLQEMWDLVFLDADKVSYIDYYELTLPHVRQGGWLLADNVLFHGEVLDQPLKGKNAKAIQAFNDHVIADQRVEQVMLTVRDGLLLIRKL
jgi:caffeoyl-CoA O-methyltransferase